jgi:prefoldin alpha subunit
MLCSCSSCSIRPVHSFVHAAVVDVTQLPPADLQKLRTSLTEDVQTITQNYGNLKMAHSKYGQALEALSDITPENKDKRIMVPLTSSLYVPGQLSNIETVLVEVGTGYYVEKQIPDARTFITVSLHQRAVDAISSRHRCCFLLPLVLISCCVLSSLVCTVEDRDDSRQSLEGGRCVER